MKVLKYGFESVRLGYNGDFTLVDYYYKNISSKWYKNISYTDYGDYYVYNIDTLVYNEVSHNDVKRIDKLKSEMYFIFMFEIGKDIINDFGLIESEFDLFDRFIKNYSIEIDGKQFRLFQIVFFRDYKMFGLGCIKVDAFFFVYNKKCNGKYDRFLKYMYGLDSQYLKRIDFYFDFNGSTKDFLKQSIFRKFKSGSLYEGVYKKNNILETSEKSTVYWGSKKSKKTLVRLYNKWIDCIVKQKLKYYNYIGQNTKRLEFEVEVGEIEIIRKAVENCVLFDFIKIVYNNVVLKKYKYKLKSTLIGGKEKKNYKFVSRFELPFELDVDLYKCNCERISRNRRVSSETSSQIKLFGGLARNLLDNVGKDEFEKILNLYIYKNGELY